MFDELRASLGISEVSAVGGFMGAVVSVLMRLTGTKSLGGSLAAIACGTACAGYVTPLILEIAKFSQRTESAIAFLIGAFGLIFAGAVVKSIPDWVTAVRERILGNKGGGGGQ